MIKNVIKRLFPKLDAVKEEKILKIFGPAVLQPNLWHINKKSVSRGFAIGALVLGFVFRIMFLNQVFQNWRR